MVGGKKERRNERLFAFVGSLVVSWHAMTVVMMAVVTRAFVAVVVVVVAPESALNLVPLSLMSLTLRLVLV